MSKPLFDRSPVGIKCALYALSVSLILGVILTVVTVLSMREIPEQLRALTVYGKRPQLLDRHGQALTITFQNRWNVHDQQPLHEIPMVLQNAFILAEDKRFYHHKGIDWFARLNAVMQNVLALDSVRGASTITEQVVRMVHIRPRSIWSRWLEGWEARQLEKHVNKASILEFYLNQVPYAAQRRGVKQAARYYFDRDLSTLSQQEMFALAVLVRAPSRFDLYKSTSRIQGRLHALIDRAERAGIIENAQITQAMTLAVSRPKPLVDSAHYARYVYAQHKISSKPLADFLVDENAGLKNNFITDQEPAQHVHDQVIATSGSRHTPLTIRTTLDSHLQLTANRLLNERLRELASQGVYNAGMIVIDHHSNEVLAWSVGDNAERIGTSFDSITQKRQPGSTLKPFVYAAALSKGWTAATMINDRPLQEAVGQGVHQYRNYSNTHYGPISVRHALGNSLNIPAIKAAKFVGLSPLLAALNQLGISDLDLRSVDYGHGIALGNGEVSLFSMAGAYATLANRGQYRPLRVLMQQASSMPRVVFSPEVSSVIAHILSDPDARALEFGRGGSLNLPIQTAVKTGTSNDHRDAWVFGYNHRYLVGVWMGNLDNAPMDGVTGSTGPALVMRSMFTELNQRGDTRALYVSPRLVRRQVCIKTGELSDGYCADRDEYFSPEVLPRAPLGAQAMSLSTPRPLEEQTINSSAPRQPQSSSYRLLSPIDQAQMAFDPRIPDRLQTLEFELNTVAGVSRIEWFINDQLLAVSQQTKQDWPISRGEYRVMAKIYTDDPNQPLILSAQYSVK